MDEAKDREAPRLEFTNDIVFEHVMRDPEIAKGVIEAVIGVKIESVEYANTQQTMSAYAESRSIRLDAYLEGSEAVYDVEMQSCPQADLGLRYRGYQSVMDAAALKRGDGFASLRRSYIIFICAFDPFSAGLPRYAIEPSCIESDRVDLECRQQWIALNSHAWRQADGDLRGLLEYVESGREAAKRPASPLIETIEEAVREANASDEVWRHAMITLEEKRESEKKAARQLGFEDGLFKGQLISEAKEERLKRVAAALVSAGRGEEFARAFSDEERLDELASELGID